MNTIFVTGTDTGVGKTLVTALVALHLRATGLRVGVLKPFATGCDVTPNGLVAQDALFLCEALGLNDSPDIICPMRLEEPLAPLVAARRAGVDTQDWPHQADQALRALQKRYDFVVVEGVGGIAVPICEVDDEVWTVADLIQAWQMPTLVVARRTLGTINHTLLTIRAAPNFAGLIFNDSEPIAESDVAAQTSPDFLSELGHFVCGYVPYLPTLGPDTLRELAASLRLPTAKGEIDGWDNEKDGPWH